jgi:hypothetical protein
MELDGGYTGTLFEVARGYAPVFLLTALLALIIFAISRPGAGGVVTPPSIRDPIPFVFNTVQFVFNNEKFMKRATYVVTLDLDHASATSSI